MFRWCTLDFPQDTLEALHEQVSQFPTNTINRKEAEVVYVEISSSVCAPNFRGVYVA